MSLAAHRRLIPSAPGYFADTDGHIIGKRGRVMSPWRGPTGYLRVPIWRGRKKRNHNVHRLVCEAFHGAPPTPAHHAAHCDGDQTNNQPANLRWATCKENFHDRRAHGTWPQGKNHGASLLTEAAVEEIKHVCGRGRAPYGARIRLARKFGVTVGAIKNVLQGRSWRHVVLDLPFMAPPEVPQ